ncbi:glycosyltransferase family 4 protein [Rubritalea sp.]|uniref:glycosyltransferase family 4 protein n=1 Tax=Rubritalea sp. TaxID=2109375 RepID=UPI003EF1DE89
MRRSIWHISWEDTQNATGGLGIACGELVDALPEEHYLISAASLLGMDVESSYSSYSSETRLELVDWERVLSKLVSGQVPQGTSIEKAVLRFNLAILGQKRDSLAAVHVHDWHGLLVGVALKRIIKIPLIVHFHSIQQERVGTHVMDQISSLEKWGVLQADHVFCVSERSSRNVMREFETLPNRLSVVHNSSVFEVSSSSSFHGGSLMFVGRICEQKSPFFMLEVLRELRKYSSRYSLVMIGEGSQLEMLHSVTELYGLEESIQWVERQSHQDIVSFYKRADILCLPSSEEPFGLVAIEAARTGCAVILSKNCGASELLASAPTCNAQDPHEWGDVIRSLSCDSGAHRSLVVKLQKEAASYTWQDAAEKVLAIYAKLLD